MVFRPRHEDGAGRDLGLSGSVACCRGGFEHGREDAPSDGDDRSVRVDLATIHADDLRLRACTGAGGGHVPTVAAGGEARP